MPDQPTKPADKPGQPQGSALYRFWKGWVVPFLVVAAILLPLRSSVADWNDVPSGSMEPTILVGDRIYVNKLAYGLRVPFTSIWLARWAHPAPGEVVIFWNPKSGDRMVKRVLAGPGDRVEVANNLITVNGRALAYTPCAGAQLAEFDPTLIAGAEVLFEDLGGARHTVMNHPMRPSMLRNFSGTVPEGHYFMMGDNRDNSADSRAWGFVHESKIDGRSSYVAISLNTANSYLPRWARFFHRFN
ncbi:MAG: signal peptidase I [Phycisphaerales bacterium]|nr:signal peptidase I [Phycisphaerales bacterium]